MDEQISALPLIPKGTRDDDYDEEGNLVLHTDLMVTTVDDDDNTIIDGDQIGNIMGEFNHDSTCISETVSITDVLPNCECVDFSDSGDATVSSDNSINSSTCDSDAGKSISHSSSS